MRSKEFITAPQIVMTINREKLLKACHDALMNNPLETEKFIEAINAIYSINLFLENYEYYIKQENEEKINECSDKLPIYFMRLFTIIHGE